MIPPVVASERGIAQTIHVTAWVWVVGPRRGKKVGEQNVLESTATEHESCVCEAKRSLVVSE